MFNDEGIRSHNQMQGVDDEGNLKNVKVDSTGAIMVNGSTSSSSASSSKTLLCDVVTVGTTETTVEVGKEVTKIEIANYSDTAKVTVAVDSATFNVGAGLCVDINVNATVTSIVLTSEEDDTTVQYLVEGVE